MNVFADFHELLNMNGHGPYVWLSYGIALALLGWNAAVPVLTRRRYLKAQTRRRLCEANR